MCDPFRCWRTRWTLWSGHHLLRVNPAGYWVDVCVLLSPKQLSELGGKKNRKAKKVGLHSMGWTKKVQTLLHFVFSQRTSNLHIAISFFLSLFFGQVQCWGWRSRPCNAGGDKHLCGFCNYDYFGPVVSWLQLQKSRLRHSPESSANKTLAYHNKQTLWTPTLAWTLFSLKVWLSFFPLSSTFF